MSIIKYEQKLTEIEDKMEKTAFEMITINVDYDRPTFNFPDLSGEYGNPYHFVPLVIEVLKKNGFNLEAQEYKSLRLRPYKEQFDNVARFLDLSPQSKIISEDDEFLYMKMKKEKPNTQQIPWFQTRYLDEIKELIKDGFDFSEKNIYGRTFLHYIRDPEVLKEMLILNKTHNWIDLLDFDNFDGQLFQTQKTVKGFNVVLEYVIEELPDLADKLIYYKNCFGITPFNHIHTLFGSELDFGMPNNIEDFSTYLNLIREIDPSLPNQYINDLEGVPSYKKLNDNMKKEVFANLINNLLPVKDSKKNTVKI